jgi:hypothetical protein
MVSINQYFTAVNIHTGLRESHEVNADSLEFSRWHANRSRILGIRDPQMLLINIHKLQVILAQSITLAALEDQIKNIRRVLGLDGQDIFILGGAENFCKGGEVDTKSYVAVASVGGETLCLEHH